MWTGLTPQYKDLQALHEKEGDKGLVIIGFPCNQVCRFFRFRTSTLLHLPGSSLKDLALLSGPQQ